MTVEELRIGEFQEFMPGVEIAEVNGSEIDLRCRILAMTSIFAGPSQADLLSFESVMEASASATRSSRILDTAIGVGEADPLVDFVIFSRTGALAVRNLGLAADKIEVVREVRVWDQGNLSVACPTQQAVVI